MSIISHVRSQVNPKRERVTKTVVLFDAGRRHRSPYFGEGILRSLPSYRLPVPLSDLEWAARELNATADAYDRHVDEMALAAGWVDSEPLDIGDVTFTTPTPEPTPTPVATVKPTTPATKPEADHAAARREIGNFFAKLPSTARTVAVATTTPAAALPRLPSCNGPLLEVQGDHVPSSRRQRHDAVLFASHRALRSVRREWPRAAGAGRRGEGVPCLQQEARSSGPNTGHGTFMATGR